MSSTINQLTETTSTEGLYVLGSQNDQSVKYNLEAIDNKIDKSNDLIGGGEIQEYSSSNNYYTGSYIKINNKIYRVTEDIYAGEDVDNKIVETSVFSEFQTIKGTGSTETLNVQILTSDNNTSPTILQNNVNIKFSDGTTQQILCDSTGYGSLSIAKGRIYSASVANQAGYHTPGAYNNIKASLSQRTLQFVYTRQWEGTSVITIELSVSNGGVINDFVGKNLGIFEDNSENYYTSSNGVIENGKVIYTFPGVTSGKAYTIPIFHDSSSNIFTINNRKYTNDSVSGQNLNIVPNTEYETLRISYRLMKQNYGIFIVKNDGTEIEIGSWEGPDPEDTDKKNTWPLLHINTEDCANTGNDYYVRCRDLTSERLASECTTKQWCKSNVNLSHVSTSTTNFIGKTNTYYMVYDSRNLSISSPAAEFVNSQVIEINGIQVKGFIGTRAQMDIIYGNTTNRTAVKEALTKLGYSNINFNSVDTWCSTQRDAITSWSWWQSSNKWNYYTPGNKNINYLVVPLFSVP